jgi:hypothetical protein
MTDLEMLNEFKSFTDGIRKELLTLGGQVRDLMKQPLLKAPVPIEGVDSGEAKANVMLAFRHLEDARMRIGQALQATEGGEAQ